MIFMHLRSDIERAFYEIIMCLIKDSRGELKAVKRTILWTFYNHPKVIARVAIV